MKQRVDTKEIFSLTDPIFELTEPVKAPQSEEGAVCPECDKILDKKNRKTWYVCLSYSLVNIAARLSVITV